MYFFIGVQNQNVWSNRKDVQLKQVVVDGRGEKLQFATRDPQWKQSGGEQLVCMEH